MKSFRKFLLMAVASAIAFSVYGQCGCDVTLAKGSDGGIYYPNLSSVAPGKKICIPADTYTYISLGKISGLPGQPITIINCGGQVISQGTGGYGYRVAKSKYFRITGTGTSGLTYGLKTNGIAPGTPSGISIMDSTSDYEVDHMEFTQVGVGIFTSKPPVDKDSGTWRQGWTNRNLSYHHNYIHNCGGEAMYLGATSSSYTVLDYNNQPITVEPILQDNVRIYNNIVDSAGWDGIQLASSPNSSIYDNIVMNYGLKNIPVQQAGIIFGGKCSGSVYNNYIFKGTGNGMQIFGYGNIKVYNNIVDSAGWDGTSVRQDGIIVDDRPQPGQYTGLQIFLFNNTVVNSGNHNIRIYNSYGTMAGGNLVINNLNVEPHSTSIYDDPYLTTATGLNFTAQTNLNLATKGSAYFTNGYQLLPASPAVNAGTTINDVLKDYVGTNRPQGVAYDIGAYEYTGVLSIQSDCFTRPPRNNFPLEITRMYAGVKFKSSEPYRLSLSLFDESGRLLQKKNDFVNGIREYRLPDVYTGVVILRIDICNSRGKTFADSFKLIK